jgi:hypothetical protein
MSVRVPITEIEANPALEDESYQMLKTALLKQNGRWLTLS